MMRKAVAALAGVVAVLAGAAPAQALDDGLARKPPMGFNNWNTTGCGPEFNEDMVKATADLFVSSGLKGAGYEYVNLDDCWALPQRDAQGRLVPDPVRFPSGIAAVADYVHSKGLKIGIYTSAGTKTCNSLGFPGALGHEYEDAAQFASWGIDYLKYDNCNNQGVDAIQRYTKMRDALKATGRRIVYSICEWGENDPWLWAAGVGHLWRTTGDISDNYGSMLGIVKQNMVLADFAGPGRWNDPDMLEVGNGGMTDTEYRSHFALWSIMAAPLLIGSDLRGASPETMDILLNRAVIRVDQDRLGVQGRPISSEDGHHVFAKPLADGDVAVALFNETEAAARISTSATDVGLPRAQAYKVRDLWSRTKRETAGEIAAAVPAHGTAMFRVSRDRGWHRLPPAVDVAFGLDVAYPGAKPVVEPGVRTGVSTTVTSAGRNPAFNVRTRLSVPAGWKARPTSDTAKRLVNRHRPFATTWAVTPPAGAEPGTYPLTATTTYRGGRSRKVTTAATVDVAVATPPPAGTSQLSDVPWIDAANGWGPVERDMSNGEVPAGDGGPITIEGAVYAKGLGAHAASTVTYYLGGRCSVVQADVGVDDEKTAFGSVTFEIWADGTRVADSGVLTTAVPAKRMTADVGDASFLRLVVTDAGDGNNSDHADWADAKLTCATA